VARVSNEPDTETEQAICGDNVRLGLKGVEDVLPGFVLCSLKNSVTVASVFETQLVILEHKNIITPGYTAVLHIHSAIEEVTIQALLHLIDKKTNKRTKKPPHFVKQGQKCIARIETFQPICVETFNTLPQLGRFTLRDEGRTIAIGKVTKILNQTD
jgi:peptide chain release factor subunit 3